MHSSRMRTARSLTVSAYLVVSHAHPPWRNHAPPEQPCTPGTTTHPPGATMHAPWRNHAPPEQPHTHPREQPRMPPRATTHTPPSNHACPPSNHACPPGATMHAPRPTTHAPPVNRMNDRHV